MSSFTAVAVAALLSATIFASPLTLVRAETMPMQLAQAATPQKQAPARSTKMKAETVEQRIVKLHKALKITPNEESNWNSVAQAMRENAANMEKLVSARRTMSPQSITAVDDLKSYQEIAQAHADGLKNLLSAFETLYNSMPDDQKKIADEVFRSRIRRARSHH